MKHSEFLNTAHHLYFIIKINREPASYILIFLRNQFELISCVVRLVCRNQTLVRFQYVLFALCPHYYRYLKPNKVNEEKHNEYKLDSLHEFYLLFQSICVNIMGVISLCNWLTERSIAVYLTIYCLEKCWKTHQHRYNHQYTFYIS